MIKPLRFNKNRAGVAFFTFGSGNKKSADEGSRFLFRVRLIIKTAEAVEQTVVFIAGGLSPMS
ncbi:MAG TPA: hypothetical protein VK826_06580, partial [Bacteroidia bacterium]|nr:hypothetical protein [Bacteroidia bacterium]